MTSQAAGGPAGPAGDEAPVLSIVAGNPTPDEIAALVVVLLASGGQNGAEAVGESGWSAYRRSVGAPLAPGPHAWRMSARNP